MSAEISIRRAAAEDAESIAALAIAFNTGARRYYERLGFVELSRRMALRL